MRALHLVGMPPGEASPVQPGPANPVFMFGTFDPADRASLGSTRALEDAVLGLKEDRTAAPAPHHFHTHTEVPADASSSAFMFGANPEQPSPMPPVEPLLNLRATEMD